jgi:arsenate reductase
MSTRDKIKVLFLCVHNGARSQMAEAYLKKFAGDYFEAESAGLEPGRLNPLAVAAMQEEGIDISKNPTKDVFGLHEAGKRFDYVITVCDARNSARCPVFPGKGIKIAWDFADPAAFTGSEAERMKQTRAVREQIKNAVTLFIQQAQ